MPNVQQLKLMDILIYEVVALHHDCTGSSKTTTATIDNIQYHSCTKITITMIVIVIVITIIRFIPVQEYQDDANSLCNPYQDGCQYVGSWYVHPLHVATCWCAF